MEILTVLILVVCGIGALIVGAVGLAALIAWWWILIPVICLLIGGWIGLFFGVGLVFVIWIFVLIAQSSGGGTSNTTVSSQPSKESQLEITHSNP